MYAMNRVWDFRDSLAYGLPWGLAVFVLETTSFAFTRESLSENGPLLAAILFFWGTRGVVLAWAAGRLAALLRPSRAWGVFPVIAVALSLVWDGTESLVTWSRQILGVELPRGGQFLFSLWPMVIYGAPMFALCLFDVRTRRGRFLLSQAESARMLGTTAIDAARVELLSRRFDPQVLLRSLAVVRQSVAAGDANIGMHMDALVESLRAAMTAVRGPGYQLEKGGSGEQ
jgi:hypothetical protein